MASSLALGVIGACTVVILRVFGITLVLGPAVAEQLVTYLLAPTVIGGGFVAYALVRGRPAPGGSEEPDPSPLRLLSAIKMVFAFQLVLLVVPAVQHLWGAAGVLGSAAVLGLADMDALTYSMARLGDHLAAFADHLHQDAESLEAVRRPPNGMGSGSGAPPSVAMSSSTAGGTGWTWSVFPDGMASPEGDVRSMMLQDDTGLRAVP